MHEAMLALMDKKTSDTVKWNALEASQWQAHLAGSDFVAMQQNHAYGAMMQQLGVPLKRGVLENSEGTAIAIFQTHTRSFLRIFQMHVLMRGPVWLVPLTHAQKAEAYKKIKHAITSRWPSISLIMPEDSDVAPLKDAGLKHFITPYHTAVWDLTPPIDALKANMDGKWRNRLQKSEVSGLTITHTQKIEKMQWLLDKEQEKSVSVGYKTLPASALAIYHMNCSNKGLCAFTAQKRHEKVAGVLFVIHGTHATYHTAWSSEVGKKSHAHNALLWHAAKHLKAKGITCIDMGGLSNDAPGIMHFKRGTGAVPKSLAGTWV